jgi:transposase InsO family protein
MLREYDTGAFTVKELCERYGLKRDSFSFWRGRRDSGEERWFEERSHATKSCPHKTPDELAEAIIAVRKQFPRFGGKKIKAWLERERPETDWPGKSTITDILKRAGLIADCKRRRRPIARGELVTPATAPNEEWSIDFKGWFRLLDARRCDPLTMEDSSSRYLIDVRIAQPTTAAVKAAMERIFREVGLPGAIRSDNGSPFGSTAAGGLSSLSVWWLRCGIEPRYIPPSSPQDNGRHERMHRTLKDETATSPAANAAEQQERFDRFRKHYNEERPHEALEQDTPASRWRPSERTLPEKLEEPWYDADHEVRRVRPHGEIKWRGGTVFLSEALAGELIGLCELETGGHLARFCGRDLGIIDRDNGFLRFAPPRARLRKAQEAVAKGEQ